MTILLILERNLRELGQVATAVHASQSVQLIGQVLVGLFIYFNLARLDLGGVLLQEEKRREHGGEESTAMTFISSAPLLRSKHRLLLLLALKPNLTILRV